MSHPIEPAFEVACRLQIAEYQRHEHFVVDYDFLEATGYMIAEKGDSILYRSDKTAQYFSDMVRAVAMASFMPGGITVFGVHYESV